jgi:hypothetical protein
MFLQPRVASTLGDNGQRSPTATRLQSGAQPSSLELVSGRLLVPRAEATWAGGTTVRGKSKQAPQEQSAQAIEPRLFEKLIHVICGNARQTSASTLTEFLS